MFLRSNARGVGDLRLGRSQAEQARAVRRPVARAELWAGPQVLLRTLGSRCRCCPRPQAWYQHCYKSYIAKLIIRVSSRSRPFRASAAKRTQCGAEMGAVAASARKELAWFMRHLLCRLRQSSSAGQQSAPWWARGRFFVECLAAVDALTFCCYTARKDANALERNASPMCPPFSPPGFFAFTAPHTSNLVLLWWLVPPLFILMQVWGNRRYLRRLPDGPERHSIVRLFGIGAGFMSAWVALGVVTLLWMDAFHDWYLNLPRACYSNIHDLLGAGTRSLEAWEEAPSSYQLLAFHTVYDMLWI